MKQFLLPLILLLLFQTAEAQKTDKRELRGAWITTYLGLDWPVRTQTPAQQRSALVTIMDHHRVTGINTVYFQVRSQSDAMYPSTLEPWSYDLTGSQNTAPNPLWDPLQFAIDESRKRGFEFHTWINPFRAVANTNNANNTAMFSNAHVSKTHPEWMLTIGTVRILNPGIPAVRDYLTNVIVDILKRYDVDGIHFDDYFYPSGTINDNDTYLADSRGFPNTTAGRGDWRRDNINLFIQRVYDSITTIKPWVKFGVSPTGIYRSSTNSAIGSATSSGAFQHYSVAYADTKKWLQEGWVDYIAPQLYWFIGQTGSDYGVLVPWWNNNAFGRHIYIGMAAYKVNDPAQGAAWANRSQIPNQVRMNRDAAYPNVLGSIFFRTQFLRNNPLNVRDSLKDRFYTKPALQPTMPWRDDTAPAPATALNALKYGDDSVVLKWSKPAAATNELDRARQFVIYRSTSTGIDIEDPANLMAITVNDTTAFRDVNIVPGTEYYYVVTSIDRFHNESSVSNEANNLPPSITCPAQQEILVNASCEVILPDYRTMALVNGIEANNTIGFTITQLPAPGTVISGTGTIHITLE
ncbi:MAG: family 10 glycosylhydrolase, partial [Flavisolibacter sp.]|nr:family 10 glycosylhydrolase [Flavisolibacter sp.]